MLRPSLFTRSSAALLALLLVPAAQAAPIPQQSAASSSQAKGTQTAETQPQGSVLPDAPSPQEPSQNSEQTNSQPDSKQQSTPAPVGTAVAPAEEPVGAAGSKPAGAVIAPAKQRRVHTLLISAALIAGAGIAIGTVAALSHASPGQPH